MEMEEPQSEFGEVLLLGSDGSQLRCLKGEIQEYSTKLHAMITDFDGTTSQLVLDLRHDEIRILVDMMTAPRRPSHAYFKYYNLDLLLRGIELFTLYDFHWWDVSSSKRRSLSDWTRLPINMRRRLVQPCKRGFRQQEFAHCARIRYVEAPGVGRLRSGLCKSKSKASDLASGERSRTSK